MFLCNFLSLLSLIKNVRKVVVQNLILQSLELFFFRILEALLRFIAALLRNHFVGKAHGDLMVFKAIFEIP